MISRWMRKRARARQRRHYWPIFDEQSVSDRELLGRKAGFVIHEPAWRFRDEWRREDPDLAAFLDELEQREPL